jgi:hypothetical protein
MTTELINITKNVFLFCFSIKVAIGNEQRRYKIGHLNQKIIFKLRFKYTKGIIKWNIKADIISYLLSFLIIIGIISKIQAIIQVSSDIIYKFILKRKVINIISKIKK